MKTTNIKKELRKLTVGELLSEQKKISQKLFEAKMEVKLRKLNNTALIGKLRKTIARINTYLVEHSNKISQL